MGTKFVLASLEALIIQLLYLQKSFVILAKGGKQNFLSSHDTEKTFVTSAKGSGLYEKNLSNWVFSLDANKSISG